MPNDPRVNDNDVPIFMVSVDGTHCRVNEPRHPTMKKNPAYYSHKTHQAGLTHEIALSVFECRVVWTNGPFPASINDMTVFNQGLAQHS